MNIHHNIVLSMQILSYTWDLVYHENAQPVLQHFFWGGGGETYLPVICQAEVQEYTTVQLLAIGPGK